MVIKHSFGRPKKSDLSNLCPKLLQVGRRSSFLRPIIIEFSPILYFEKHLNCYNCCRFSFYLTIFAAMESSDGRQSRHITRSRHSLPATT